VNRVVPQRFPVMTSAGALIALAFIRNGSLEQKPA